MDPAVLSAIVIAVGGIVVNYLTNRNNRRGQAATTSLDKRKVDLDEFREVQARNEAALARADAAIARVEAELAKEHEAREAADLRAEKAERRAELAEQRALEVQSAAAAATRRLSRRIEQLEMVLTDHDMPVPPPD